MKRVLSKKEMAYWDSYTIENKHIPALVLMERAALACVEIILEQDKIPSKVGVICGSGNNGGDGVAIARILKCKGISAHIYMLGNPEKYTDSLKAQLTSAISYEVPVYYISEPIDLGQGKRIDLSQYDYIVDAIFGIGLSREVNGDYAEIISIMNKLSAPTLAVDIPSGYDADTGAKLGIGVKADYTVTFGYAKKGLYLSDCYLNAGKIIIADIGIYIDETNKNQPLNTACYILDETDIKKCMPLSSRSDNKGTRGKVLIIAGSENIYGACFLSVKAALTAGCGLARVFTHQNNIASIQQGIPEAMYYGYTDFLDKDKDELVSMIKWADAVLIGPGLGTGRISDQIMQIVLDTINEKDKKPLVIDADGINILSNRDALREKLGTNVILTPHLKEMSRLCGDASVSDIQNNMELYANRIREQLQCNIDLKSFTSFIVTNAGEFINTTGNEGMATAGSGDVLAGIMVSILAQGVDIQLAPAIAAYLHGKSGEAASKQKGMRGMLASDCISEISNIL